MRACMRACVRVACARIRTCVCVCVCVCVLSRSITDVWLFVQQMPETKNSKQAQYCFTSQRFLAITESTPAASTSTSSAESITCIRTAILDAASASGQLPASSRRIVLATKSSGGNNVHKCSWYGKHYSFKLLIFRISFNSMLSLFAFVLFLVLFLVLFV